MSPAATFKFRLFIADHAQNAIEATSNLTALCSKYLPDRHEIEIVDVYKEPSRALAEGIFMTPTLIKLKPLPVLRIVGNLSQPDIVLRALGLAGPPE